MDGPEINERAFRFACQCVELYGLPRKAGGAADTSIGANLEEASGGAGLHREDVRRTQGGAGGAILAARDKRLPPAASASRRT